MRFLTIKLKYPVLYKGFKCLAESWYCFGVLAHALVKPKDNMMTL